MKRLTEKMKKVIQGLKRNVMVDCATCPIARGCPIKKNTDVSTRKDYLGMFRAGYFPEHVYREGYREFVEKCIARQLKFIYDLCACKRKGLIID